MKSIPCESEHFIDRIIFMSMFDEITWGENDNTVECRQNSVEFGKYARRFHRDHCSFLGSESEKAWYKTCCDQPNREWDRTAAMMILQMSTESDLPVFEASRVFERGKLDIKEYDKKSTRFDNNEGNIEILLCVVISMK